MFRPIIVAVMLVTITPLLVIQWANSAHAEPTCHPQADMIIFLANHYGELRTYEATLENGQQIDLYTSPENASWTFVIRFGPYSCIAYYGQEWNFTNDRTNENNRTDREDTRYENHEKTETRTLQASR